MGYQLLSILFLLQLNLSPVAQSRASVINHLTATNRSGIYSGTYGGQITISIKNGILTGLYEYYDKWDDNYKDYTDISIVYFYGESTDGVNYKLTTRWSAGDKIVSGGLHFINDHKALNIRLSEQPPGYASFDFTGSTKPNIFRLQKTITIAGIRLIKPKKAVLYNFSAGSFIKRKGYLVSEDAVMLLHDLKDYSKISYYSRTTGKSAIYWIKDEDVLEADPVLWVK